MDTEEHLTCALLQSRVPIVARATLPHTLALQAGIGRLAALALVGALALRTLVITAWKPKAPTSLASDITPLI